MPLLKPQKRDRPGSRTPRLLAEMEKGYFLAISFLLLEALGVETVRHLSLF